MTPTKAQRAEIAERKAEAIAKLREMLPPGSEVRTILEHTARSGMSRSIKCIIADGSDVVDITGYVAAALGTDRDRYWGITRGGCGMDFGWDLVYSLSRTLYPDGFACIGDRCPSNDHSNGVAGPAHSSGGYALKQRWL